jgi:hypothetical protein
MNSLFPRSCLALASRHLLLRVLDPGDAVVHVFRSVFSCCHLQQWRSYVEAMVPADTNGFRGKQLKTMTNHC